MKFLTYLCLYSLVALPLTAAAESVAVGDSRVSAIFIQPYDASFKYYSVNEKDERVLLGTWTDDVTVTGNDDKTVLRRKVIRYSLDGAADFSRTTTANADTMGPIASHQTFGDGLSGVSHVDFDGTAITQILLAQPEAPARVLQADLGQKVFEGSFWATLAMSLPFEEGLVVEFPTYTFGGETIGSETYQVHGEETLEAMGETFTARKITAPDSNWTFWVRKEAPYIVRIEHPLPSLQSGEMAVSIIEMFHQGD